MAGFVVALGLASSGLAGGIGTLETQQDATEIDSCTTITDPGRYVLTDDIQDTDADTCIDIRASDVVLDGNGSTIDSNLTESDFEGFQEEVETNGTFPWEDRWARIGIAVTGPEAPSNVTVQNVEVSEWFFGIYAANRTAQVSVQNVTSRNNADGISFYNAEDVTVTDSIVQGPSGGVVFDGVTGATVRGSEFRGAVDGVLVADSSNVTIAENRMTATEDGGFLYNVSGLEVRDNEVTESFWTAFAVFFSDGAEFTNNTIAETRGNVTFRHDTADVLLHNTSNASFDDTVVRDSGANWTVYATNSSRNNTGSNFSVGTTTLTYSLSNVAFSVHEDATDTGAIDGDTPVLVTNTGNESTLELEVQWSLVDDVGTSNGTTDDEPPGTAADGTPTD